MKIFRYLTVFITLIATHAHHPAHAVAYCALRDPYSAIQTLYPEADSHYSIVRIISPETRDYVGENLPFSLHFNELGKHTLYVVTENQRPMGLIHARSEPYSWGLVEIVWSLNTDLSIRDFKFQRCRSKSCKYLETDEFKTQLQGKNQAELKKLLASDGQSLREGVLKVPQGAESLALSVVRSALKTSVVTEYAWRDDLIAINPKNAKTTRFINADKVEKLDNLYNDIAFDTITLKLQDSATAVIRDSVKGFQYLDSNGELLGYLISADLDLGDFGGRYQWAFSADGTVLEVTPESSWPSNEVHRSFEELEGKLLTSTDQCATAVSLATYELTMLLKTPKN